MFDVKQIRGGGVPRRNRRPRNLVRAVVAVAALSMLWALPTAPAQAQTGPKANDHELSSIECVTLTGANIYICTIFFYGKQPNRNLHTVTNLIEGMPVFVAVTQQRLVGTKDPDAPEAWTRVAKPETMTFGTGADSGAWRTDSTGGFQFRLPIRVMTCIKDFAAADDEAVSTDGAADGSADEAMRCKNKHMHERNARYHISWWADACFDTCPPSYSVRLANGRALNDFTPGRNKNLPHQIRLGRNWLPLFRNPHFGKT